MVPMYVLMSAFHSAPWLKLISRQRRAAPRSPQTGGAGDKDPLIRAGAAFQGVTSWHRRHPIA
jgi:hypothetical protein